MPADGAIAPGEFGQWVKQQHDALARAATVAVDAAGEGLKNDLRASVRGAGLGTRLGNAIRNRTYPNGNRTSISAASTVAAAPGADEILQGFIQGATIRARNGKRYLTIATPAAGKGPRGGRITPAEYERRHRVKLRFVPGKRGGGFLVLDTGRLTRRGGAVPSRARRPRRAPETITIFILVPVVRLAKRLDPQALYRKWQQALPQLIERALPRS
jgi:hypothetical protein